MTGVRKTFIWWVLCLSVPLLTFAGYALFIETRSGKSESWRAFTSQNYGFTGLMPGAPKERTDSRETALGTVRVHSFISEIGAVAFAVSYTRYTTEIEFKNLNSQKRETFLESYEKGALGKDGTLLFEGPCLMQNYTCQKGVHAANLFLC